VGITAAGCASARVRKENALALAAADAKVLEGCYDCLQDARRTFERLAAGKKSKDSPAMVARLFETDVLIALREKELGLDSHGAMERARALAPRVPATFDARRVIALADHALPDGNAYPLEATEALLQSNKPFVDKLDTELAWMEQAPLTPAVRKYIALAVDCSYPDRYKERGDTTNPLEQRREVPINAPPLLAYRAANCAKADTLGLKRVLAAVPQFDEAAYALGNVVVWFSGETGGDDARKYYASAYARFPHAAGITFMSGWLELNVGDCREAIRYFDETVAMQPEQERAILQKAIRQSTLHEDSAAIATATRFIALETPDIATGYYWRAISRLRRKELEMARSDIELAKARSRAAEVLTAAGIIEFEQTDFIIAETDLRGARAALKGDENCNAGFYLGSVLTKARSVGRGGCVLRLGNGLLRRQGEPHRGEDRAGASEHAWERGVQGEADRVAGVGSRGPAEAEPDVCVQRGEHERAAWQLRPGGGTAGGCRAVTRPGGAGGEAERTAGAGAAASVTRP